MRLSDNNPGALIINPEREIISRTKNLEATKVSDEEYHRLTGISPGGYLNSEKRTKELSKP